MGTLPEAHRLDRLAETRTGRCGCFRDTVPTIPTFPRKYDVLVVDEAHNVAPSGTGNYAVDSQRTRAIRAIAPYFEHRLFLTATPHNGYQESFSSLLELLDDQRFARGIPVDENQLAAVMVRRLKGDIVDWKGERRFAERKLVPIEVEYTDDERRVHSLLEEYTELRQRAAEEEGQRYATEFVLKLLKKRLFSSPAAFGLTLERHLESLESAARRDKGKQLQRSVGVPTASDPRNRGGVRGRRSIRGVAKRDGRNGRADDGTARRPRAPVAGEDAAVGGAPADATRL